MRIIEKIHSAIFAGRDVLDSFENALLDILEDRLPVEQREIIVSQRMLFTRVYRDYDEEQKKETSYFYWQYFGKSRLDFPKRFTINNKEQALAKLVVTVPSGAVIHVSFWVVNGILFYIEFNAQDDFFRPLSPDFEVKDIVINEIM